jgi:hypothetical protein
VVDAEPRNARIADYVGARSCAAIALLWEDYQTWKEGGKSLIDWGKWKPEVDAALKMVGDLKQTVLDLGKRWQSCSISTLNPGL